MRRRSKNPGLVLVDSGLIKWALHGSNDFAKELAMHSILRAIYRNGVLKFPDSKGKILAKMIGVTEPTARERFKRLIGKKWIIANGKAKIYRIVSTKVLLKRYGLVMGQAALLRISQLQGKNPIGPFIGAFIGFQNKMQSGQRRTETGGRKYNDTEGLAIPINGLTNGKGTSSASYPKCTDKRLSKNLGCGEKKAQRYKKRAKKVNSIQIEIMARADPGFLPPGEMGLFLKYNEPVEKYLAKLETESGTLMYLRAASKVTSFIPILARRWIGKRKKVS